MAISSLLLLSLNVIANASHLLPDDNRLSDSRVTVRVAEAQLRSSRRCKGARSASAKFSRQRNVGRRLPRPSKTGSLAFRAPCRQYNVPRVDRITCLDRGTSRTFVTSLCRPQLCCALSLDVELAKLDLDTAQPDQACQKPARSDPSSTRPNAAPFAPDLQS